MKDIEVNVLFKKSNSKSKPEVISFSSHDLQPGKYSRQIDFVNGDDDKELDSNCKASRRFCY